MIAKFGKSVGNIPENVSKFVDQYVSPIDDLKVQFKSKTFDEVVNQVPANVRVVAGYYSPVIKEHNPFILNVPSSSSPLYLFKRQLESLDFNENKDFFNSFLFKYAKEYQVVIYGYFYVENGNFLFQSLDYEIGSVYDYLSLVNKDYFDSLNKVPSVNNNTVIPG